MTEILDGWDCLLEFWEMLKVAHVASKLILLSLNNYIKYISIKKFTIVNIARFNIGSIRVATWLSYLIYVITNYAFEVNLIIVLSVMLFSSFNLTVTIYIFTDFIANAAE